MGSAAPMKSVWAPARIVRPRRSSVRAVMFFTSNQAPPVDPVKLASVMISSPAATVAAGSSQKPATQTRPMSVQSSYESDAS
jgi:hypothetical protein